MDTPVESHCADVAGFHPIPRRVARMKLPDHAKSVLGALLFLAKQEGPGLVCHAAPAEIGAELGYSAETVRRARRDLEAVGLIVQDLRKGGHSAPIVLLIDLMGRDVPAVEPLQTVGSRVENPSKRWGSTPPNGGVLPCIHKEPEQPPRVEPESKTPEPPEAIPLPELPPDFAPAVAGRSDGAKMLQAARLRLARGDDPDRLRQIFDRAALASGDGRGVNYLTAAIDSELRESGSMKLLGHRRRAELPAEPPPTPAELERRKKRTYRRACDPRPTIVGALP